jgi:hypothetical protein
MVLAFMAQHVWEVGASVLALLLIGQGLFTAITGSGPTQMQGISERATRTIGGLAVLIGVGVGIAAFAVDAEQLGVHGGDGWGGTGGIIVLCVWVALMCAGPLAKLVKSVSRDRSKNHESHPNQ